MSNEQGPGVLDVAMVQNWHARYQALLHENERLRERPEPRVFPVHIRCDGKGCASVVAFDPAPEEPAMMQALLVLGWELGNKAHLCRGCR